MEKEYGVTVKVSVVTSGLRSNFRGVLNHDILQSELNDAALSVWCTIQKSGFLWINKNNIVQIMFTIQFNSSIIGV